MLRCREKHDARTLRCDLALCEGVVPWLVAPPRERRVGATPTPAEFQVRPWAGWVPERICSRWVAAPPCPRCKTAEHVTPGLAKWSKRGPRRVLSATYGHFWLDAKSYPCAKCKKSFLASDPHSVVQLPLEARRQFALYATQRSAVDSVMAMAAFELFRPLPSSRPT